MSLVDEMESYEAASAVSERMNDLVTAVSKRLRTLDPMDPVARVMKQELSHLRDTQRVLNEMTNASYEDVIAAGS